MTVKTSSDNDKDQRCRSLLIASEHRQGWGIDPGIDTSDCGVKSQVSKREHLAFDPYFTLSFDGVFFVFMP